MGCVLKLSMLLICLPLSTTLTHRLQYFYTATSGVPHIPEFISVGMVDGVDVSYYDSNIKRSVPRQTWMEQIHEEDYWGSETHLGRMYEQIFRKDIEILGKRFNHTGGVHVLQKTYGCQWDDKTGATDGHEQFGYDGEDFLTLDLENMRWIAVVPQAVPTKQKWDNTERFLNRDIYFKETCADWLKKYLHYGSSTLGRKVSPDVSVFQRDSSAVCHATGFYPERVMITWKRDGEEMQEDVDVGETLPNMDGTFQKRVVLTVSPEERRKSQYTCEVAHESGHMVKTLSEEDGKYQHHYIPSVIVGVVVIVIGIAVKMRTDKKTKMQQNKKTYIFSRPVIHGLDYQILSNEDGSRMECNKKHTAYRKRTKYKAYKSYKKHTKAYKKRNICCRQDMHKLIDYWEHNEEDESRMEFCYFCQSLL